MAPNGVASAPVSVPVKEGTLDRPYMPGLEDFWLATDAYIYGYPLVTMEMTRRVMTNVATPQATRAPMGQLIRAREYPNASYRDVTAPKVADDVRQPVFLRG
jgi:hypothetical protein